MIKNIITDKKILSEKSVKADWKLNDIILHNLMDTANFIGKEKLAGLAAPQIGHFVNIILVNISGKFTLMINPTILSHKGKFKFGNESCLSRPSTINKPIRVKRWYKVRVGYTDHHGEAVIKNFKGFESVLIQHEIDHLQGVLIGVKSDA